MPSDVPSQEMMLVANEWLNHCREVNPTTLAFLLDAVRFDERERAAKIIETTKYPMSLDYQSRREIARRIRGGE